MKTRLFFENIVEFYNGPTDENDLPNGVGAAISISGGLYTGDFVHGSMDGHGNYVWPDGTNYVGNFKANAMTGDGVFEWSHGRYNGKIKNGVRHGDGKLETGEYIYEGYWNEGKVDGYGILYYDKSMTCYYKGDWKDGKKHGNGIMIYKSGNVYEGQWVDNVRQGHGRMIWKDRSEEYDGEWRNGLPHGFGIYVWGLNSIQRSQYPVNNRYEGEWVDGKRQGYGTYQYATGASYTGEWLENRKHGQGTYISENGRTFCGRFEKDRMENWEEKSTNGKKIVPYEIDCPYHFEFDPYDLQRMKVSAENQVSEVNKVIFRYMGNHMYCPKDVDDTKMMTKYEVWRILKDSHVSKTNVSLGKQFMITFKVDIDRAYAKLFKNVKGLEYIFHNPHDSTHTFMFQQMLQYLICTSIQLYGDEKNLSLHEKGVAACFSHYLKESVIPFAHGLYYRVKFDPELEFLKNIYREAELSFMAEIHSLYQDLSICRKDKLKGSDNDNTVNLRDFLLKLKEYKMISQADSEKPKKVVDFLLYMFPCIYKDDVYDLTFEILPTGMFDTLFDLALVNTRDIVSNHVDPLLNNEIVAKNPDFSAEELESLFVDIQKIIKFIRGKTDKISRASSPLRPQSSGRTFTSILKVSSRPSITPSDFGAYERLNRLKDAEKLYVFQEYIKRDVFELMKRFIDNHLDWKKGQYLISNNLARESKQDSTLESNEMSTQTSIVDLNSSV